MATVTHRVSTPSTSQASSYASGSFTPSVGDLLIGMIVASDTTGGAFTMTNSAGITFTLVTNAVKNSSLDAVGIFIANSLIASATSQTCTFNCTGDAATGCVVAVASVAGMTLLGGSADRQLGSADNGAAASAPNASFAGAALTGNVVIALAGNGTNPAGLTPPATFSEANDTGYNTPPNGLEYAFVNSGFTGSTVTWGSNSASAWGAVILELDTSVPTQQPYVNRQKPQLLAH